MNFDIWLFHAINHLPHGTFSDNAAVFLSFLGQEPIAVGIAVIFIVIGLFSAHTKLWKHSLAIALGGATGGFIVDVLKMWIARPRPYEVLSDAYLVGEAGGASFPSWHSAWYAFLAGYMLLQVTNRHRFFWVGLAFLGGFVRVYQGFHYPSDIVGGWVIGALLAWLTAFLFSSFNVLRYNGNIT